MLEDHTQKKSLGQHWLKDELTLEEICRTANILPTDTVLEIGPGLGTLTELLVQKAQMVMAVEVDDKLAVQLLSRVKADNLKVVNEDILQFDLTNLAPGYKLVANIPYYLTSTLIRVLSESTNPPQTATLLVQKEVAERLAATPGKMSLLSVTAQFYWQVELGRKVLAELFTPPPKVDSQIVFLKYRSQPLFPKIDSKRYFKIVRAGFSQKRKTLLNSLSGGLAIPKDEIIALLDVAKIIPSARAQTLSLEDWYRLYQSAKELLTF